MSRQLTEQENQIRERARDLMKQLAVVRGEQKRLVAELKHVQANCTHPDAYNVHRRGENAKYCPLCGWES